MRLLPLVALTFWLVGCSARIEEDRREYRKGLNLEDADEEDEDDEDGLKDVDENDEENDEDHEDHDDDDGQMKNDDTENSGKTKETSVHRKHFMDQYFLQSGPVKYEFGHVCEDPEDWQQRYEKRDFDNQRHQGQVKWGDAKGGYGEQLWDFNHDGNIEDELDSNPWPGLSDERKNSNRDGKKAMGVIKEKVTITKKRNGKTIDQTKINMEKLAGVDDLVKNREHAPFAGDIRLMEEFRKKTGGVKNKYNPFEEEDTGKEYFTFNEELRRMGRPADVDPPKGNERLKTLTTQDLLSKATSNIDTNLQMKGRSADVHAPKSKQPLKDRSPQDILSKATINIDTKVKRIGRPAAVASLKRKEMHSEPTINIDTIIQKNGRLVDVVTPKKRERSPQDLHSLATMNFDTKGKVQIDPISGSLTDQKTGRKFTIFGVLIDS